MRTLVVAAGAVVALALFTPAALDAQDYRGTITAQLDAVRSSVQGRGYRVDTGVHDRDVVVGALAEGASVFLELSLTGGVEYYIVAGCDQDCSDLDTRIYPADSRTAIDEDTLDDDAPILEFTAPRTSRYMLAVTMADCDESVCYFGYRVLRR